MNFSMPALDAFAASQFQGQQLLLDAEDKRATIESKQAQTLQTQQETQARKQQLDDRASLSKYMMSAQALDAGKATGAADNAKLYTQASQYAAKNGDFEGAKTMSALAKQSDDIATNEMLQVEKGKLSKSEQLSTVAQDVAANPTPENHKALVSSAIAAGVDPATIPLPGTKDYSAFVNQSALQSLKGAERLKFLDSQREHELARKAADEQAAQRQQDRAEARADRAAAREQANAFQRESLDIRRQMADSAIQKNKGLDADGNKKLSATVERQTIAVTNAANEAGAALERMSVMNSSDRASAFNHLEDGTTVIKALTSTGTNKLVPARVQMMQANSQLLGMEVAQAMAAPYKPGEKQISEARKMSEIREGDTEWTAIYKMALTADILKTRLQSTAVTPTLKEARATAEGHLNKFPSANEVYAAAKAKGVTLHDPKAHSTFMDKLKETFTKSDTAAMSADGPTAAQQALLDQYK